MRGGEEGEGNGGCGQRKGEEGRMRVGDEGGRDKRRSRKEEEKEVLVT